MTPALSAVVGLGFSQLSRQPIGSTRELAIDAIVAATADAGLELSDIDGLFITRSSSAPPKDLPLDIQSDLGIPELKVLSILDAEGASAVIALQQATMAIQSGMARSIACVFADARVQGKSSGSGFSRVMSLTGIPDWEANYGLFGAIGPYAFEARRFMHLRHIRSENLGSYVLAVRQWASGNPLASQTQPLTMEQYLQSRWIVEPLRLLDCAYPVNGAIAVVITATSRVPSNGRKPVFVHGFGQGHNRSGGLDEPPRGSVSATRQTYAMAGIGPKDVSMCQLYDAFSFLALQQLEDYGICTPG